MPQSTLSNRLKQLRDSHNYTQEDLGNYLNMTRQGYAHYENGKRVPDYHILLRLSFLYNTSIEQLVMEEETVPVSKNVESTRFENLSKREQKLLSLFSQLSISEQEDFMTFLQIRAASHKKRS